MNVVAAPALLALVVSLVSLIDALRPGLHSPVLSTDFFGMPLLQRVSGTVAMGAVLVGAIAWAGVAVARRWHRSKTAA